MTDAAARIAAMIAKSIADKPETPAETGSYVVWILGLCLLLITAGFTVKLCRKQK